MEAKVGSIINVSIWRADGTVDNLGDIHNVLGVTIFSSSRQAPTGTTKFYAISGVKGKTTATGTWMQSAFRIQRVTGTMPTSALTPGNAVMASGDMVVFGSGERSFVSNIINVSAFNATVSKIIPETTLQYYGVGQTGWGRVPTSNVNQAQQTATTYSTFTNYSSGVITCSATTTPIVFPTAAVPYTLESIVSDSPVGSYLGASPANFFDVPSTPVGFGDAIVINSYKYVVTFDDFRPRAVTGSALSGTPFDYVYQRLKRVSLNESTPVTRIYLIDNATPFALPDMLAPAASQITPSNLTIKETVVAFVDSNDTPSASTETQDTSTGYGILTSGQANVKQIAWGDTGVIFGIISFNSAMNLSAGRVIAVGQYLKMISDLV